MSGGDDGGLERGQLTAMIDLQLSEVEMLQSMFPGAGECCVDDPSVLVDLREYAEGRTQHLPPSLDLALNIDVGKGQLRVDIRLPHKYPAVPPVVFVRSNTLHREAQRSLNQQLQEYLETFDQYDLAIGPAVTWLQERGETFFTDAAEVNTEQQDASEGKDAKFSRLWIYSHHIYSKVKRKDILDLSKEFDLTGFCLPGKPGIICVEGLARNTEDWWHQVRSWNWQKILVKTREEEDITPGKDFNELRRFSGFEELGSENDIRVKTGGHHVDMGDVFRYLDGHASGYIFKEYFGVDGKPS